MSITRSEVIQRAATIWPLGHVPYSQMTVRNPGWRTDCSGYASMCLDLSAPGLNTVSLVTGGYIQEITPMSCSPGTWSATAGLAPAATPGTSSCSTTGTRPRDVLGV